MAVVSVATNWISYVLLPVSSSFIYLAVKDLIPQMQHRAALRETIPQIVLATAGVAIFLHSTGSAHHH